MHPRVCTIYSNRSSTSHLSSSHRHNMPRSQQTQQHLLSPPDSRLVVGEEQIHNQAVEGGEAMEEDADQEGYGESRRVRWARLLLHKADRCLKSTHLSQLRLRRHHHLHGLTGSARFLVMNTSVKSARTSLRMTSI